MDPPATVPTRFVALDLHKDYIVVGAVDVQQRVVLAPRRIAAAAFETWARTELTASDAVVLEATTTAWQIHDLLVPLVASVTVAHPLMVKLIAAARVKTDRRDTINLAKLLAANLTPVVWVPPLSCVSSVACSPIADAWSNTGPNCVTGSAVSCTATSWCRRWGTCLRPITDRGGRRRRFRAWSGSGRSRICSSTTN